MKKFFCVLTLLSFAYAMHAQTQKNVRRSDKKFLARKLAYRYHLLEHFLPHSVKPGKVNHNGRTTEIDERLIAQSEYSHAVFGSLDTGFIQDSAMYGYSGTRSSYFSYNFMDYYNSYQIDGSMIFGFGSGIGFLDHNDNPSMLSDTTAIFNPYPFTVDSLVLYDTRYAIYDANNNITNYADVYPDSGIYSNNRYINTYDTSQNITTSLALSQNPSFTYDTSEFRIFSYNTSHKLMQDSTSSYYAGVWTPLEKWLYSYDGSGNMIQASYFSYDGLSTWTETWRYLMTYYGDNTIQTVGDYADSSYGWVPMTVDSFGYTSGISYATFIQENTYADSGYLELKLIETKHISTSGLPDTVYAAQYLPNDSCVSKSFSAYFYDSYMEPTKALSYQFLFDAIGITGTYDSTFNDVKYYYYGSYFRFANGTSNVTVSTENIKIYPNPATTEISIYRPGAAKGAYTRLQLINTGGQLMRSETLPWLSETEKMSLAGLVPGMYWLVIQDKSGNNLFKQTLIIK